MKYRCKNFSQSQVRAQIVTAMNLVGPASSPDRTFQARHKARQPSTKHCDPSHDPWDPEPGIFSSGSVKSPLDSESLTDRAAGIELISSVKTNISFDTRVLSVLRHQPTDGRWAGLGWAALGWS